MIGDRLLGALRALGRPRGRKGLWIAGLLALPVFLILVAAGLCALFVQIPEGASRQTLVFYAAPLDLQPGTPIGAAELRARLSRLGYRAVVTDPEPGQYRDHVGEFEIHLRPFRYPGHPFPGGRVRVRTGEGRIQAAESSDGVEPGSLRLEPERIAGFEGETGAVTHYLRLEEAPPLLVEAILVVEDSRFWRHPGVDPVGIARALLADFRRGEAAQGASTITQQLARSLFLHNRKTVLRKVQEAVLALGLELRYSKREILEAYLNAVYWGHWGSFEIRGAREASQYYLGRDLATADPAGLALLAGLIQAPNLYSPYSDPERARARRDFVLGRLRRENALDEKAYGKALRSPLPIQKPPLRPADAAYFLEAARREVEHRAPAGTLARSGTAIFTTLDMREQTIATAGLRDGLLDLEREHRNLRRKKEPLEGAVVVIEPETGEVKALVGGRDFQRSPFNRASEAHRQPGSLMKPFVYLAAFREPGRDGGFWTPATRLEDEPLEVKIGNRLWSPQNYDREFRGEVTVRQAIEQSLNVPTARVALEIGVDRVAGTARDLGIRSPLEEVPSLALGTSEVTLLEITGAYAGLAASGKARTPTLLRGCADADGIAIDLAPIEDPPGVRPPEAYLITRLLEGAIDSGTGRPVRALGIRGPVAGKTGTTDDYRDAWFEGYDPDRAVGVWVGFDRRKDVGLSGSAAALPIWARVFGEIRADGAWRDFTPPAGVVTTVICPKSGGRYTGNCPDWLEEVFLSGTEPREECPLHGGGFFRRLQRFFGR